MSDFDEVATRLECLRLAHNPDTDSAAAVERARTYADFVLGRRGTDTLRAASEPAAPVRSEG